jgi:hypothetical protein
LDVEARDPPSRAREINIKSWPRHRRTPGYYERAEIRKTAGSGKNCIRLEHRSVIDFTELREAIAEGRANDGLDDFSGNMAVFYIQAPRVAASKRCFSYDIDARRQVWATTAE